MKAERRHELKTNTLAQGLGGFPVFWARYGTKVLLGVVAILAIVLFLRVQRNTAIQQREAAGEAYSAAVGGINSLQTLPMTIRDPRQMGEQARQIQTQVETAISQVLDTSDDDAIKAEALIARGDLHWHLARLPGIHGSGASASTRPTTGTASTQGSATQPSGTAVAAVSSEVDEVLEKARRAYDAAARAAGAKPVTVATARFGLAAVAEQRGRWDEARKAYEELRDDVAMPQPFRDEAKSRLDELKDIQQPVLIGKPATLPSLDLPPVEQPSATAPVGPPLPTPTTPASAPTTTATAPTTKPQ